MGQGQETGIHILAQINSAPATAMPGGRQTRGSTQPFPVRYVAWTS